MGRIVRKIENILIQFGEFRLPGKKALHSAQTEWNILVVDVSESPIERPKKPTPLLQWQAKVAYVESSSRHRLSQRYDCLYRVWQRTTA